MIRDQVVCIAVRGAARADVDAAPQALPTMELRLTAGPKLLQQSKQEWSSAVTQTIVGRPFSLRKKSKSFSFSLFSKW